MIYDVQKIREILPHRYPLLLVDRITAITPNQSIEAYKNITINEEIFNGHFPIQPIYPGVYIIEGMAQAGGVLAFISMFGEDSSNNGDKIVYFMSIDKAKFRNPVTPGDTLVYKLEVVKQKVYWKIPNNYLTMMSAINKGVPVNEINPESNIAQNYMEFASKLSDYLITQKLNKNYNERESFV